MPPLSATGLERFADFERMSTAGTSYLDPIFIRAKQAENESLHFHELVHVVQWRILGPERFLWLYADGLERFGYRKLRAEQQPNHHHNFYVVLLDPRRRPSDGDAASSIGWKLASLSAANSCCANLLAFRPDTRIFKPVRQKPGFPKFASRKFIRSALISRKPLDSPK